MWSAEGTTPDAIEAALRELVKQRHGENGGLAPARALNMVAFVESRYSGEIANRLAGVGRYHASRLVVLSYDRNRTRLDARVVVSTEGEPAEGELGLLRETVTVEIGARHMDDLVTIVDPLVVTDLATLLWSPHGHPEAVDALLELSQTVLVDSVDDPSWREAIGRACAAARARLRGGPRVAAQHPLARAGGGGVRLAGDAFRASEDRNGGGAPPSRLDGRGDAAGGLVELAPRLGGGPARAETAGCSPAQPGRPAPTTTRTRANPAPGAARTAGTMGPGTGGIAIRLEQAPEQDVRGLESVAIAMSTGRRLGLKRGPGGLRARGRDARRARTRMDDPGSLARGERDPRRGHPPVAAARPDLRSGAGGG